MSKEMTQITCSMFAILRELLFVLSVSIHNGFLNIRNHEYSVFMGFPREKGEWVGRDSNPQPTP